MKEEPGATLNASLGVPWWLEAEVGVEAVVDGVDTGEDELLARRLDTNAGSDPPAHVIVNTSKSLSPFSEAVMVANYT